MWHNKTMNKTIPMIIIALVIIIGGYLFFSGGDQTPAPALEPQPTSSVVTPSPVTQATTSVQTQEVEEDEIVEEPITEPVESTPQVALPTITTRDASNITESEATLNGNYDTGGDNTVSVWFEYGLTQTFDSQTLHVNKTDSGLMSVILSDLQDNTTYYFRATGENTKGTSSGTIQSFRTQPKPAPQPQTRSFQIDANDAGYTATPSPLTVSAGDTVQLTFTVLSQGTYFAGLQFRGSLFDTGAISPGSSKTIEFTAESDVSFTAYWPNSGVRKWSATIRIE